MPRILHMVVEHFKNKDAVAVYRRFRDRGRLAPHYAVQETRGVDDNEEVRKRPRSY